MKWKYAAGLIAGVLCTISAGAVQMASAEQIQPELTIQSSGQMLPDYTIFIGQSKSQIPLTETVYEKHGVMMVPLRPVAERLGYTVDWDNETQCAYIGMNIAYMYVYPGVDMYERIGSLKTINLNHIYQYGTGPENIDGVLYVPAQLFEAFFNDVFIEDYSLVIAPQESYVQGGL